MAILFLAPLWASFEGSDKVKSVVRGSYSVAEQEEAPGNHHFLDFQFVKPRKR